MSKEKPNPTSFQQHTAHNLCEGYLWKSPRGFFGGKWRKRFFCLNNDSATIGYFDGLKQKGNIKVHHQCYAIHDDSKQCPEEPAYFVFRVDNRNEKIYLASKTATEREVWINHINSVAKHLKDLQYSKNTNIGKNRQSVAAVTGIVQDDASSGGYIPKVRLISKETFFNSEENMQLKPPPAINSEPTPLNYPKPKGIVFPPTDAKDNKGGDKKQTGTAGVGGGNDNKTFLPPPPSIRNDSFKMAPPPLPSALPKDKNATRRTWKVNEEGDYRGFYVWGANSVGQLGFNETEIHCAIAPKKIKMMIGAQRSVEIACAGDKHTFCLTKNKKMYLSGSGKEGQLGCGKMKVVQRFSLTRTLKGIQVIHIACGAYHTVCQTKDGNVLSWGTGLSGCLGLGPDILFTDEPLQVQEVGVQNHVLINRFTCGPDKTIFITHAGIVKACGLNGKFGALGLETSLENVYTPTPVLSLGSNNRRITDAGLGANFSAYLNEDGHVYVCGQINMEKHFEKDDDDDDDVEEEMDDKKEDRIPLEPFTVPTLFKIEKSYIKAIAAGHEHLLALVKNKETGRGPILYSMGNGQNGRLGHGDTEDVNDGFKLVESLKEIPGKQISCGGAFSAVLSKGGSLFTFGDGHGGELGNGALLDVNIPLRIHEPEEEAGKPCHYSFISCGSEHMISIVSSGEATGAASHYADITHLKDDTVSDQMNSVADKKKGLVKHNQVYYKDFNGKIFGPMPGEIVRHWYDHNLVSPQLTISLGGRDHEGRGKSFSWVTIKDYFK